MTPLITGRRLRNRSAGHIRRSGAQTLEHPVDCTSIGAVHRPRPAKAGYREAELHASPERNSVAIRMYQRLGFREVAHWIALEKRLRPPISSIR
jgi:hypothetical protein